MKLENMMSAVREGYAKHLYFHIPFCAQICPYCDFYKHLGGENEHEEFISEGILAEINFLIGSGMISQEPKTLYFGGGTPSLLSYKALEKLLIGLQNKLNLVSLEEWTLEADPKTFSLAKAKLMQTAGISRISFGAQSFNDTTLSVLGRLQRRKDILQSFTDLRNSGFKNISIDLIIGTPGESKEACLASLDDCINLAPEHISAYILTYEKGTPFYQKYKTTGKLNSDSERIFYDEFAEKLAIAGYINYEISNYAKNGFESAHNKSYWRGENYIGIGPGASSTLGNLRWKNIASTKKYIANLKDLKNKTEPIQGIERTNAWLRNIAETEMLSECDKLLELVSMQLRTRWGTKLKYLEKLNFNKSNLEEIISENLAKKEGNNIVLTDSGKPLADSVVSYLL